MSAIARENLRGMAWHGTITPRVLITRIEHPGLQHAFYTSLDLHSCPLPGPLVRPLLWLGSSLNLALQYLDNLIISTREIVEIAYPGQKPFGVQDRQKGRTLL